MKNYFRAWPGALGGLHIINGSRDLNLQSKAQFKSKIFQRRIDLNISGLIEPHWKISFFQYFRERRSYIRRFITLA